MLSTMSRLRKSARTLAAVMIAAGFVTACDVHGVSAPGSLARITVTPNATLAPTGTQQLVATGYDADGKVVSISPTWSVAASGGTISQSGVFTAGSAMGVFANTAVASVGGVSGSATITVTAGPLAFITLTPTPVTLAVGATQQFTAVGRDAGGNIVAFAPTWSVVAGGGSIGQTGLFTAGGTAGAFVNTVQVSANGLAAFATVNVTAGPLATLTVTPNPATLITGAQQQFVATGRDAGGNIVAVTPVWTVAAGGGTISATGLFTAGNAAGTFTNTVTATSGALSGTATVIVNFAPLATITVTPNPATLAIGATQQFTAVGRDAAGNVLPITPTWSVVNGGGTINATGSFTAGNTTGTFGNTVQAMSGGLTGTATVVVTGGALASITVTPNPATLPINGVQQFTAVGRDGGGNIVAITPTWAVINGGGTINATGQFTAGIVPGTFNNTVRATSGAISGTATVTVTTGPLATITVTPNPATLAVNTQQQFVAVGRDAGGNQVLIVPVWTVVNGGGSIIGNSGLFTAGNVAGTFNNTVRATVGAIFGSATVTVLAVLPPPPAPFINLGAAGPNGIMAGTAFTCVALGVINADIAISPGSTVTGFPPCLITGVQNLANAIAAQAQIDLTTAYNQLAGLPCAPANVIVANLGGTTLTPGTYCSGTSIGVTGNLVLDGLGDPNAVFVFQAGTGLTTAGNVILMNGASARNVYWQVGSSATIGTASQWQGNILALTSITLVDNANLNGRALARNGAVSLGTGNVITLP